MNATATKSLVTANQLLKMGDIGRCELICGELIMISPVGAEHGIVALRIGSALFQFVDDHGPGVTFGAETGFKIDVGPDTVRAPDASFVRKSRLSGRITRKFFNGSPDLAVEVVSPEDTRPEVNDKENMWLAKGTATVWIADPKTMTVAILHVGQPPQILGRGSKIRGEPLLPGFELSINAIFKMP
jgi:Uma2 family endonuclease